MTAPVRLAVLIAVFVAALTGWAIGGFAGAATALALVGPVAVVPWRGRPLWSWLARYRRHRREHPRPDPVTVANDGCGGGVRELRGTAVAAVAVLGRRHRPTLFTGSTAAHSDDTLDVAALAALLHQPLGLTLESLSVVTLGARRRSHGDYPRVYDTLIGTPPYAGTRETWVILRIAALPNAGALADRISTGVAAVAAAQRIGAALRRGAVRARVASAADIVELDRQIGGGVRDPRWRSVRADDGWYTSYAYRPHEVTAANLAQAWTLRVDGLIQTVTLYPDGRLSATLTTRTNQPPPAPPSVLLTGLPGEQLDALAAARCGPTVRLRGLRTGPVPAALALPVGASGVLIGPAQDGYRLALPFTDPGEPTRIRLAADDALTKRLVLRAAAAGERITVHTADRRRWAALQMPGITVTDGPRPAPDTTVSVVDGAVSAAAPAEPAVRLSPAPRPPTVIEATGPSPAAGAAGDGADAGAADADIVITQAGPDTVDIGIAGRVHRVRIDLFRVENRYLRIESEAAPEPELAGADR